MYRRVCPLRARHLILIPLLLGLVVPASAPAGGGDDVDASALTASEITPDGARLSGTVAPAKRDTSWWIAYATPTQSYAATTPATIEGDDKHRPVARLGGPDRARRGRHGARAARRGQRRSPRLRPHPDVHDRRRAGARHAGARRSGAPPTRARASPRRTPGPSRRRRCPRRSRAPRSSPPPTEGTVRVRVPGSDAFVALDGTAAVPVGTVVDATRRHDRAQHRAWPAAASRASSGARASRSASPPTGDGRADLHAEGRQLRRLPPRPPAPSPPSRRATARKRKVRRLWGKDDGGRFRTHGRDSVATVRGTQWVTTDRCDGTVTKVLEGAVDVRDRHTGRVVRVEAGAAPLREAPPVARGAPGQGKRRRRATPGVAVLAAGLAAVAIALGADVGNVLLRAGAGHRRAALPAARRAARRRHHARRDRRRLASRTSASSGRSGARCTRGRSTRLRRAGARVIVYDVQFTEPTRPREDLALFDAVARTPAHRARDLRDARARASTRSSAGRRTSPRRPRRAAAANLTTEPGDVLQRFRSRELGLPTLAAAGAALAGGPRLPRVAASPRTAPGSTSAGRPGTIPSIPFEQALVRPLRPGARARPDRRGRRHGADAPGDLHPTPTSDSELMSGPEVQANAIWTALHGLPLRSAPDWVGLARHRCCWASARRSSRCAAAPSAP